MMTGLRLPPGSFLEDPLVQRLFAALDGNGETVRVVGGAVRNALIGRPIGDIDFATTALPAVTKSRAEAAGLKPVPTGEDHGTITVVVAGRPFEVTTLRLDVETDGRRAVVVFGRDWEADAARRDFTLNALYADRDGRVLDPLGGWPDLEARRVRFIGDADARIREDALRILRFFRFTAEYGDGPLDPDGFLACIRERHLLRKLSRERVRAEMIRLFTAKRAPEVILHMAESGLMGLVLHGVPWTAAFQRLVAIEAALNLGRDPILRLGVLAVRIREDVERLAQAFRLSRFESATLGAFVRLRPMLPLAESGKAIEAFLYRRRADPVAPAILYAWALSGAPADDPHWRTLAAKSVEWHPPERPFKGEDLVRMGVRPGPSVGVALAAVERWWIEAGFPTDAALLTEAIRKAAGSEG